MLSFDFQCLPYVTLKIMCDCSGIDNTELPNVSYSEWCGKFFFVFGLRWFTIVFVTIVHCNFILKSRGWTM